MVRRILPTAHQDEATVHACIEAYAQEYAHHWNVRTKPYPGVPEMLDGLVKGRLKLAVLSNKPDRFTQQCVRELLPKWIFDVVLGASDIEGAEIAAETLTVGDPSFAGPLAGVSLGLPIYHILEPDVRAAVPEDIYEQSAGIVAMVVDTDEVAEKFRAIRANIAKENE